METPPAQAPSQEVVSTPSQMQGAPQPSKSPSAPKLLYILGALVFVVFVGGMLLYIMLGKAETQPTQVVRTTLKTISPTVVPSVAVSSDNPFALQPTTVPQNPFADNTNPFDTSQ